MNEVTRILDAIADGDEHATRQLLPLVYGELRKLAAGMLTSESPGQTLQPTALVHEAFVRLVGEAPSCSWDSRGHFFAAAAEAMRRILVENARRKRALKRGGELARADLDQGLLVAPEPQEDLVALDEALDDLSSVNPLAAQIVQLRYFAGLTAVETGKALKISERDVRRKWAFARAWLKQKISKDE